MSTKLFNDLDADGNQLKNLADGTDEQDAPTIRQLEVEFPFAFGDASPRTVRNVAAGKLVRRTQIHITEAFDGAGAALAVGDAGDAERLMAEGTNDPTDTGTYETNPAHRYGSDTDVLLTITPGAGASAGAGLLVLTLER